MLQHVCQTYEKANTTRTLCSELLPDLDTTQTKRLACGTTPNATYQADLHVSRVAYCGRRHICEAKICQLITKHTCRRTIGNVLANAAPMNFSVYCVLCTCRSTATTFSSRGVTVTVVGADAITAALCARSTRRQQNMQRSGANARQ